MTDPIRPDQVKKKIPSEVIQIVNDLISEAWDGKRATIKQNAIVAKICDRLNVKREFVFAKGWLDFEILFENAGWEVTYDRPSIGDTYEAYFRFEKK